MKNITLLSLIAAAMLFNACGDDTKKAAAEATAKTKELVNVTAADAEEAEAKAAALTKKLADEAAEAAENAAEELKKGAHEAAAKAKEEISKVAVAETDAGKDLYAKCAGCHGKDGKTKALGKSEVIAGQPAADLASKLEAYKAGTRNVAGMGMLMKGQVANMSEGDLLSVSEYISGL